ncbi:MULTISPECIES: DUF6177 family protein [unclassified Nocardiopsis]|uniref:DUF6177 family protein n=1 Tax=unclassified Nocardiopsis TaxID=2649073 RepID=UPI001F30475E|nr:MULTISPECIES: DUF6177 family protein [unclassified Nocardiopsis]
MTQALVQAGPKLRVRSVADGALIQLRDESGRMVAAVQAAQQLALSAEADRLLTEGITDDLPAQPWWVEARGAETGPTDADTAGMVRRFADALVSQFGGLVWEPESRLVRDDPLLVGATDHPAITLATDKVAVAVQDRPVVPLTTWLVDAIAEHGRAGRGFQLVTPSCSRITHALCSVLGNPMARWVAQAPDGRYYDGFSGVPLAWHKAAGFVRDTTAASEDVPHPAFQDTHQKWGTQLLVDLKVLHPADAGLQLGRSVEFLSQTLGGSAPALWGTGEPATLAWDTRDLTALARKRAPASSWLLFTGPPDGLRSGRVRPFTGTLLVTRVPEGVKESITLAVGHSPTEEPDLSILSTLVKEFTSQGVLQTISVHRRTGRADLGHDARWSGPALPVGLGIGVEGVSSIGSERTLSAPVPPITFGPPLTHSVWYRIGDGTEAASQERFHALMAHLHPGGSSTAGQRHSS